MNKTLKTQKIRKVLYGVVTIITALAFLIPGLGNLLHVQHFMQDMQHLGYPSYFSTILGSWKIMGALVIVLPGLKGLKEWAYAGMIFDLTGAAFSRLSVHDPLIMIVIPLLIACIVLWSWFLRPTERRHHLN